jgi:PAS domain S-box-containing protein
MVNRLADERGNEDRRRTAVDPEESCVAPGLPSRPTVDQVRDRLKEPKTERWMRRRTILGLVVAILVTALLGFLSWSSAQQSAKDADWVAHTHAVSTKLELTLRHLVDVETGERGFDLTGMVSFLEPYETGKYAVGQDLQALRLLTIDNRGQQRRLDVLSRQANARIEAAEELVRLKQNAGAISNVQLERAKTLMDAARATVQEMEGEEDLLLKQRTQRTNFARRFTVSAIVLGSIFGIIFLSLAGVTVSREIGISTSVRSEFQRAEAALRESEGRLAGVIASATDAIIATDDEQRIVLFNRAAEKMFACPATEAIGQSISRFIPERFRANHAGHIRRFSETGATNRAMGPTDVLWALRADGQEFQIEASISQVVTAGRKLFTVILRDVTERKQAEEVRERLAAVVESSEDAIISKTLQGTITAWNRGAENMFGYSASEAVGQSMLMLIPSELVKTESEILTTIRRGDSVGHFETLRVRKDGKSINISATISPIRDNRGAVVGALKIARDITERKSAEEAVRQSDARRKFALETAKLGDWELDLTTLQARRSLLHDQIFGYQSLLPEWSLAIFLSHVHPDDRERVSRNFQECIRQGNRWDFECRIVWANGDIRWIWACGSHYHNLSNDASRMFGIVEDITNRKKVEEDLRESEAQFRTMLNGIPQLAWMAEADGHVFWYNKRWYEFTGTSSDQMEGWGWQSVHDPQYLPKVLERWRASIAGGTDFEMEFPLRAADGCFGMFLTRIVPLKDANGRVLRWFGTNTDISERARAEQWQANLARELSRKAEQLERSREALEQQTGIFKLVLDSMGEGLIAADQTGHFLIFNHAAHDLMGRGPTDLPTEQWTPHYQVFLPDGITPYPPEQLPLVRALQGESVQVELIVQRPEILERRSLEVTARPLRDARGSLCGGVAVLRDISERNRNAGELARQAQELLRSRQDLETQALQLQSVLDSMVEGLVTADEHGKFIIWNPAAEKIVGLSGTNVPPGEWRAHYDTYLPDTVTLFPTDQHPLHRAIRGEASTAEMFIRNPKLDHGIWIEANGSPLRDKNGVVRGGLVAFRDITQRKADEQMIRHLNEDLEERITVRTAELESANRELEAFSYSVSHDLRAPLRHIGSFAKILSQDFGSAMDPEARRHLERIENGARRMTLLVDGLLSLARLGQQSLKLSLTELNAIVSAAIAVLQQDCHGREVEWRIGQLPALECDPFLMGQVFQNLLGNALKYSSRRPKSVIEVGSIHQAGEPPVIFVRDNGAGFSMQYADKLFGVFQRLHTEAEFEGTGVGLATVHRIIQKHGGRIWTESEEDHGATFYFTVGENAPTKTTQKATDNGTLECVHE